MSQVQANPDLIQSLFDSYKEKGESGDQENSLGNGIRPRMKREDPKSSNLTANEILAGL